MKALFLAGGKGTRLRPITDDLPKPMIPIMGKPLLEWNIENLKNHGIDEVVLSTCYKSHKIENYFGDGKKLGVKISYISEDMPLGTGGAIKNAEKFFAATFLVFNADILSDIDISDMIRFHRAKGALATIAVTRVDNPSAYGVIEHDEKGYITAFKEKPKPHETKSNLINTGVYIFEPEVLREIPSGRTVSIERETYPQLLRKGFKIAAYHKCSYWLDLGTPEKYVKAHRDILKGTLKISGFNYNDKHQFISKTAKVHETAIFYGPVFVGDNVEISAFAVVGPYTVLGHESYLGTGAKVVGSVVWDQVSVGSGASVVNSVVLSNCIVDRNSENYNTVLRENFSHPIAV